MDTNRLKQLQEWNNLLKNGAITQDEFNKKKAELLGISTSGKKTETQSVSDKISNEPEVIKENVQLPTSEKVKTEPLINQKQNISEQIKENKPVEKSKIWIMIVTASLLFLITAGTLSYFLYFKQKWIDDAAPRYYVTAKNVSLRSSKVAGINDNSVGVAYYGDELIVYNFQPDWSEVKANNIKCFVSSKYILNKSDFLLLNNIFSDNVSRDAVETNKCRMALLDFVKRQTTDSLQRLDWKIYTRPKDVTPNAVFYPKHIINPSSRFSDFAFMIKNIKTNDKIIGLYSFTDDETPQFVTSFDIHSEISNNIVNVTRSNFNSEVYFVYLDNGSQYSNISETNPTDFEGD